MAFDNSQPRDKMGQWTVTFGGSQMKNPPVQVRAKSHDDAVQKGIAKALTKFRAGVTRYGAGFSHTQPYAALHDLNLDPSVRSNIYAVKK